MTDISERSFSDQFDYFDQPDPFTQSEQPIDAFINACCNGHIDVVRLTVNNYPHILEKGLYGACSNGHDEIVKFLLHYNISNKNDAFAEACLKGHTEIVKLLFESNGTTNNSDVLVIAHERKLFDIVKYLIEKGVIRPNEIPSKIT